MKTLKRKHLFLAIAALLASGALWFAGSAWRADDAASEKSSTDVGSETRSGGPQSEQRVRLAPPDPTRRFREFTPQQRVEFARKGHGPGG